MAIKMAVLVRTSGSLEMDYFSASFSINVNYTLKIKSGQILYTVTYS